MPAQYAGKAFLIDVFTIFKPVADGATHPALCMRGSGRCSTDNQPVGSGPTCNAGHQACF